MQPLRPAQAADAMRIIRFGDTVATSSFLGIGLAEEISIALQQRFIAEAELRNLTLVYAAGQGDGKDKGLNHLAHERLLKRVEGGHCGLVPKLGRLAMDNRVEVYNLPHIALRSLSGDSLGAAVTSK